MTFDKPEHREIIIEMLHKVTVPGHLIEQFYELKVAVNSAEIDTVNHEDSQVQNHDRGLITK